MAALNPYMKAIVAILGAAITAAATFYGNAHWFPILSAVVTAATVYLVPNTASTPAIVPPVSVPAVENGTVKDSTGNAFGSE